MGEKNGFAFPKGADVQSQRAAAVERRQRRRDLATVHIQRLDRDPEEINTIIQALGLDVKEDQPQ
jgi:hypothetical protein